MKLSLEARRRWLVVACFIAFYGLSLACWYVLSLLPSFQEKCVAQCLPQGLEGHMVPMFPRTMTGVREGPKVCKCFTPGRYEQQR
jgi:hypothetical protein